MTPEEGAAPLQELALSGIHRELTLLAARGLVPLPLQELVSLQVKLLDFDDEDIRSEALKALQDLEPGIIRDVISDAEEEELVERVAREFDHPVIVEAVLRRRETRAELLKMLAPRLSEEMQEILLLRQDRIVEDPTVLAALEENEEISSFSTRRIAELREHLLHTPERVKRPQEEEKVVEGEATEEEVAEAVERAREEPAHGDIEEQTGLSETQIRGLPVPVRLKLSRGASLGMRRILVRDTNPLVAVSALTNSPMPESEIERIAASRMVVDDVLEEIGRNRTWSRKYSIAKSLVENPRTPVGLAIRLTSRMSVRDLKNISRDRDVPEAVRSRAASLYKMKQR